MMTTKATIHTAAYVELLGGVVQAATGDAIVDVIEACCRGTGSTSCA